jgi:ABC-type branched-subunit amino acid transport system substrate-binding protein
VLAGVAACALTATGLMAAPAHAASRSAAPGVTAKTVTVGQIADISEPVPGLFKSAQVGVQAYFDYINSKGGVNGRKLVLDSHDSAFQPATVTSASQEIAKNDLAFVGNYTLLDSSAKAAIDDNHVPNVGTPLGTALGNDINTYSPSPSNTDDYALGPYQYFRQHDKAASQHMALLYAAATPSAIQGAVALKNSLNHLGYKIVYYRGFSAFETTFTADVVKMKNAGVKMFYMDAPDNYIANVAKEFALQDFHPIFLGGVGYGSKLIPLAGSAANGIYIQTQVSLFLGEDAKTVPAVKTFDTWMKKVDSKDSIALWGATSWASAALFVQALRNAGKNPTRASLVAALNKITNFDAGGLVAPADPAQAIPAKCWLLAQVKNEKVVRISPSPRSGYICNPAASYETNGWKPLNR